MEKIHYKLIINPLVYHLKWYKFKSKVQDTNIIEYGFLCFKIIKTITNSEN